MRLFKSNKSQASIDRLTSSRSSSPDPYGTGVAGSQAGGAHFQAHRDQGLDRFNPPPQSQPQTSNPAQYQDTQVHSHPAHIISRSSAEAPGYADSGRRPSVPIAIVPPTSPGNIPPQLQGTAPVPGQTQFGQSNKVHVHTEKEHKRSKRSIFGFSSSKDRDKENSPIEKEKKGIGRSGSVQLLRKNHPGQQPLESQQQPQSPSYIRHSAYFGRSDISREHLPEDPSHYEQYRNQAEGQGQYDSPSSQYRQSPDHPDNDPHFSPQREHYQPYHQPEQPNTSDQYLPYQGQGRPSGIILEQQQALRPPSQSSLNPPSPLLPTHQQDSRPSTAATSRYSTQSVGAPQQQQQLQQPSQQPQPQMARGDPPNGGMRQQMRDPRDDHREYQQDPRARMSQQIGDQGRNSPQPRNRDDHGDYNALLQKHEELQAKYSKVKRYYFEREAQVTQLQNTVATQRLSMSKTSLDDAQYSSRFERLSGAINNLSFNIRKDWKNVPPWLRPVCNQEAHATGTKEMTAVGRACITRWLYETVFQQVFHPGIERSVSSNLKHIEQNLRRQGQTGLVYTDEQRDDLLTKITTWRLTTIEGLQDQLGSKFAAQYQDNLVGQLTVDLTNSLKANLNDPPPPGLQESVTTIISQAVSICANIPMESRDVCIEYFMPGSQINETYMKVETGMTPLSNPGLDERVVGAMGGASQQASPDEDEDDEDRERDVEAEIREATKAAQQASAGGNGSVNNMSTSGSQTTMKSSEKRDTSRGTGKEPPQKSSFLGAFVGKKPPPSQSRQGSQRERTSESAGQSETASVRPVRGESGDNAEERSVMSASEQERERQQQVQVMPPLVPGEGKIRFAVFLAAEVRGKMLKEAAPVVEGSAGAGAAAGGSKSSINVLYKAPVYEL